MSTIFNRKLLITIMDMKRQADIRYKLESAHIDYVVRTKNQQGTEWFGSGNRGRYGSMGINTNYSYEYKIYVHKNDYEKALHVIR